MVHFIFSSLCLKVPQVAAYYTIIDWFLYDSHICKQTRRNEKKFRNTNYEIFSATSDGRRRKFFVSNRL